MGKLVRFGVSLEKSLLDEFDALVGARGFASRSEALRDLIRGTLLEKKTREGEEVAGALTLVYDHHRKDLMGRITDIQHDYHDLIISTQHIHLDHDHCLEIIAVRGRAGELDRLADSLRSIKGVMHGTLSVTTAGRESP